MSRWNRRRVVAGVVLLIVGLFLVIQGNYRIETAGQMGVVGGAKIAETSSENFWKMLLVGGSVQSPYVRHLLEETRREAENKKQVGEQFFTGGLALCVLSVVLIASGLIRIGALGVLIRRDGKNDRHLHKAANPR